VASVGGGGQGQGDLEARSRFRQTLSGHELRACDLRARGTASRKGIVRIKATSGSHQGQKGQVNFRESEIYNSIHLRRCFLAYWLNLGKI